MLYFPLPHAKYYFLLTGINACKETKMWTTSTKCLYDSAMAVNWICNLSTTS